MATSKAKASKLVTQFIKQIAEETHEDPLITGPAIDDAHMITKAEALARFMWRAALGYKEEVEIIDSKTGRVTGKKEVIHFPDKAYVTLLYDRLEGRVPTVEVDKGKDKPSVTDKVSNEGKNRLNSLAKKRHA
ncbi:MAG: hypothetical protein ACXAEN_21450 [Candidatus Thorarchaeota archaeon]|jgi:hypothetical protein